MNFLSFDKSLYLICIKSGHNLFVKFLLSLRAITRIMSLSRAIKKNNDEHILRISIICQDSKGLIEEVERALLKANIIDSKAFKFIEDRKNEVDALCKRYTNHLEECTQDFINVDAEMVERVKLQTAAIRSSIVTFTQHLPEVVRKKFPSYLLRAFPAGNAVAANY